MSLCDSAKTCPKCLYSWETRTASPKVCPRCKLRLDNLPAKYADKEPAK